jgi:hypothetical protein
MFRWISEPLLRLGLWMNGVTGRYADEIIDHHYTGRLPRC